MNFDHSSRQTDYAPPVLLGVNPVLLVTAAVDTADPNAPVASDTGSAPFTGMSNIFHPPGSGGAPSALSPARPAPLPNFLWWALGSHLVLAWLAWRVGARRLRVPAETER